MAIGIQEETGIFEGLHESVTLKKRYIISSESHFIVIGGETFGMNYVEGLRNDHSE